MRIRDLLVSVRILGSLEQSRLGVLQRTAFHLFTKPCWQLLAPASSLNLASRTSQPGTAAATSLNSSTAQQAQTMKNVTLNRDPQHSLLRIISQQGLGFEGGGLKLNEGYYSIFIHKDHKGNTIEFYSDAYTSTSQCADGAFMQVHCTP